MSIKLINLLTLTVLMMTGCEYQNADGSYDTSRSLMLETVVIDSCEYISGYYTLSHKGNCKFCEKRRQRELNDIIRHLDEIGLNTTEETK